jgi:hypothetical protein
MIRKTDWQDLPLSEIQGIPGAWISSTPKRKRDEAWTKVSELLRPVVDRAKERRRAMMDKGER